MGFSENLQNKSLAANNSTKVSITHALVLDSDEKNNVCTIRYVDHTGAYRGNKYNVPVRLYGSGTDYFPKRGDSVLVEESFGTCVVIARDVSNFAKDVLSNMELIHDVYSDNSGAIGGWCY